jgi:predicted nucleic acid-binding protein
MTKIVVLDSGVFDKIFLDESDRNTVIEFFQYVRENGVALIAPSLFMYEVLAVAASTSFGSEAAYELIRDFIKAGFSLIEPDESVIRKAMEISNMGHPKSGYPTFYDSSYHALALVFGGIFLTADARHKTKTTAFGSVVLIADWKAHFID